MGEYATYRGEEIKIGTCEDLYYLRADQRQLVTGYPFDGSERYRFPWPDEDHLAPGCFDRYDRAAPLRGLTAPASLAGQHYSVQFTAAAGYLTSLPCPEAAPDAPAGCGPIPVNGLFIHRNGFAGRVLLCQQKLYQGFLVAVVRCGGCGLRWRLSQEDAITACTGLLEEGRRRESDWHLQVGQRLAAGYSVPAAAPCR